MRWELADILAATGASVPGSGPPASHFASISTDSRALEPGDLFVPLVGERFDAHGFVETALGAGAAACLWGRPEVPCSLPRDRLLLVEDTLEAYQQLGSYHLRRLGIPVVAVTGSTGKTTTKDLIASLLGTRYRVLKTEGNFNNDVGVPLTLLKLTAEHQVAVLELAMRGPGQIRRLARLLEPRVGVITNIGHSHLELLGSREAIAHAKGEMLECVAADGWAVLPAQSEFLGLLSGKSRAPVLTFSAEPGAKADQAPLEAVNRGLRGWEVVVPGHGGPVRLSYPLPGRHHLEDLMAALLAARQMGVSPGDAIGVLADFRPTGLRMELVDIGGGITLLNDSYNAAPDSMEGALEVLSYAEGRKVAVLADMLELGAAEAEGHARVGRAAARRRVELLVAVGPRSKATAEAARAGGLTQVFWVSNRDEAQQLLLRELKPGDAVLLKGSRGMGLDQLVPKLEANLQ